MLADPWKVKRLADFIEAVTRVEGDGANPCVAPERRYWIRSRLPFGDRRLEERPTNAAVAVAAVAWAGTSFGPNS